MFKEYCNSMLSTILEDIRRAPSEKDRVNSCLKYALLSQFMSSSSFDAMANLVMSDKEKGKEKFAAAFDEAIKNDIYHTSFDIYLMLAYNT